MPKTACPSSSSAPHAIDFEALFATRMMNIPRSFLREILKTALEPGMISFAGGLPNKELFPIEPLRAACDKAFSLYGADILQYSNSEGLMELRAYIAEHYKTRGIDGLSPDNIFITSGSQQALDLIAKVLVNEGDRVLLEEPSYLGAIQALAIYRPNFVTVPLLDTGLDTDRLKQALSTPTKLMYVIPNFQNPSGISYTEENRRAVADIIRGTDTLLVEDDPYGELRFSGQHKSSFMRLAPENTILLGTFSKTLVPGFRLGWLVMPPALTEKILIAKQAADLHTNIMAQRVVYQYLLDNDLSAHVKKIIERYGAHKQAMIEAIAEHFPASMKHTNPEGGMFLWAELPHQLSAMKLFEMGLKDHVCVVPGHPFYLNKDDVSTVRLNFSCSDVPTIHEGIKRLGHAAHKLCEQAASCA